MAGQAKILTSQEIGAVFKLLETQRDKTIFALGVYTGMRISEIISLEQDQVFTADGGVRYKLVVKRLKKKNTVYSDIPLHGKLRQILEDYKKELNAGQWLFPSSESASGHLVRVQAHNILVRAFRLLKLEGATTHSMRRTFLTTLSRAGTPLRTIQQISGHSNLGQLQSYLEVDPEDKLKAINVVKY